LQHGIHFQTRIGQISEEKDDHFVLRILNINPFDEWVYGEMRSECGGLVEFLSVTVFDLL
jgi:hypothetical protein